MNGTIDYSVLENEQLAKLESGSRTNVLFKPSKRMKKRRQLDALVSNGKKLPRRKQSGHELLRSNDSDSSEVEEFSVLENHNWGKRWPSPGCCSTCYTLACILVAALCLLACTALIWMHLQLKHDFNELKDRVQLVENKNAGTPEEFQALQAKLSSVNRTVTGLRTGSYGLEALNKTIISMQKQITALTATAAELKKTVQTPQPNDKEHVAVANTVAELGADFKTVQADVEKLKTQQKSLLTTLDELSRRVTVLENPVGREGEVSEMSTEELLSEINTTLSNSIALAMANVDSQQSQLDAVEKFTQDVDRRLKNVSQEVEGLRQSQHDLTGLVSSLQQGEHEGEKPGDSGEDGDQVSLSQLYTQMQHLQLEVNQVQAAVENQTKTGQSADSSELSGNRVDVQSLMKDHEELVVFRTEVLHNIHSLNSSLGLMNASVEVLNQDVEELFSKQAMTMADITNISTVVEGLTTFLQTLRDSADTSGLETLHGDQDSGRSETDGSPPDKGSPEKPEEEGKSGVETLPRQTTEPSEENAGEHQSTQKTAETSTSKAHQDSDMEENTTRSPPGTTPSEDTANTDTEQ